MGTIPLAISVIIPLRRGGSPEVTLKSLAAQTFQNFEVIVSQDEERRGANWARNRGFEKSTGDFLLFSDDDIRWEPDALAVLRRALKNTPRAAYSYGSYAIGDWMQCAIAFRAWRLRETNFISTMSLIRRTAFPSFDESIQRLQDWDLWLTMLEQGHTGVYCGRMIFRTEKGKGITYGDGMSLAQARSIVRKKHGLT